MSAKACRARVCRHVLSESAAFLPRARHVATTSYVDRRGPRALRAHFARALRGMRLADPKLCARATERSAGSNHGQVREERSSVAHRDAAGFEHSALAARTKS